MSIIQDISEKERAYRFGIAEGFKRAALACEGEILPDHVDPPKDAEGQMLRQTATASMTIMAVKFRRMADEALAKATESEGPEHE